MKILVMGLPGSGKTTLAVSLKKYLEFNGDLLKINVSPSYSETTGNGLGSDDWNISCEGFISLDKETSTATINATDN